jgi:predicted component of type VI protein secretion system
VVSRVHRTFKIGRSPDCDVVLADQTVSRHHAEIVVTPSGQLLLNDCRSTHGTAVIERGVKRAIAQETLRPDATIRFGEVTMTAAELMEAVRVRHPDFTFPAPAPANAPRPPERPSRRWAGGARLVRCACGAVKPKARRCPECGE